MGRRFECLESESSIKVQAHASYQCWGLMIDCATLPSNTMTSHARRTLSFLCKFEKLIIVPTPHQHHILALSEHCVQMNIAAVRKRILVTWLLLVSVAATTRNVLASGSVEDSRPSRGLVCSAWCWSRAEGFWTLLSKAQLGALATFASRCRMVASSCVAGRQGYLLVHSSSVLGIVAHESEPAAVSFA